jgi:hypothetical protein
MDLARIGWMPSRATGAARYAAICGMACVPIFSFAVLPLGDMPHHLARIYILNHLATDLPLPKCGGLA